VHVPEGMGLKILVTTYGLSDLDIDEQRFIHTAANEWVTPNFSTQPHRLTLRAHLLIGDLSVGS